MKAISSLLALFLFTIGGQAAVIYSQPASAGISGYLSSTFNSGGSNLEEFVWDSFSTPTTCILGELPANPAARHRPRRRPGQMTLARPEASAGWVLQESTDLVAWTLSTHPITTSGAQKTATITAGEVNTYFRLARP